MAAIAATVFAMCAACGMPNQSASNERFVDGDIASANGNWQAIADAIMADGKVTRAETEQAIESYYQCMDENGFSGSYAIDLDIYYWVDGGSWGLDPDVPGYQRLPERFQDPDASGTTQDDFSTYLRSAEGKALMANNDKLEKEHREPCKVFDKVEEMAQAAVDWAAYDRRKFDAIVRCIAANAPAYADRARSVAYGSGDTSTGVMKLSEEFFGKGNEHWAEFVSKPEGSEEYKLNQCFQNPNGVPMRYFGQAEYSGENRGAQ